MDKPSKTQILKFFLIAALLGLTPLLSTSLRSAYLYFIFNLLIIAHGADAGLLSFFSKPSEEKKPISNSAVTPKTPVVTSDFSPEKVGPTSTTNGAVSPEEYDQKKAKPVVAKCSSEKIVGTVRMLVLKKCPSTPSLFFIGGGPENEVGEEMIDEDDYDEEDHISEQELFHKAETFIGNFYKQLKMQREDSWKKIHGLYHKAF